MRIAAVGDNCVDVYDYLGKAFPGGNPVNVAVYMVRLGMPATYVGVVGQDQYGKLMKSSLENKKVDVSHLREAEGSTAVTKVELINGDRVLGDYFEGVLADFQLTEEEIAFLQEHDLVHSGIWGKIDKDLKRIKAGGPIISFDFADKLEHALVDNTLPGVDYAFFSYDQDDEYIRNYIKTAQGKGPKVVVATLGENGSVAYDGQRYYQYGIVSVPVVDTMGAGDSYIAGFMKGVLEGMEIEQCMALGAQNAAVTIQYNGAW